MEDNKTRIEEVSRTRNLYMIYRQKLLECEYLVPYGTKADKNNPDSQEGLYVDVGTKDIMNGHYIPTGETYYFGDQNREDLDQYIWCLETTLKNLRKSELKDSNKAQGKGFLRRIIKNRDNGEER